AWKRRSHSRKTVVFFIPFRRYRSCPRSVCTGSLCVDGVEGCVGSEGSVPFIGVAFQAVLPVLAEWQSCRLFGPTFCHLKNLAWRGYIGLPVRISPEGSPLEQMSDPPTAGNPE